jgi:hypothetical protein
MKKQIILDFHSPYCTKVRYTTCFRKSPIHNFRAYLKCPLTNYLSQSQSFSRKGRGGSSGTSFWNQVPHKITWIHGFLHD